MHTAISCDSQIQLIRASFSTWLADRNLFMTLGLLAQVNIIVQHGLDTPIAISMGPNAMTIRIRPSPMHSTGNVPAR